ncbi:MAG TPA: carboxymuconolactone decarboxylase family protein [Solirubrobacteraceae bacterium]|nr:carboxymuconolactone decarboxylase family protein [Solirubrobacteraceae bacterium]
MKTQISRFQIHDELTAPEDSLAVLRGALGRGGQLPNFLGVLAGAPAALKAYARFRSELRHGHLQLATIERIALAVAAHHGAKASLALHARTARAAGLGLDEAGLARSWDSYDPKHAALLKYLHALMTDGTPPVHLHEQVREAGWSDEELLEAIAVVALESFTALINVAGDVPGDGSPEISRRLEAA